MASAFDTTLTNLGIARAGTTTTAAPGKSKGLGEMGSNDFIALLTAQMKNQDPFEPVDNSQMVAQMAQFSSLAGITEMGSTLKSIAAKLGGSTTSDAMNYVGKTVLTAGTLAYPRTAGGFAGGVELDGAASSVTLTIKDAEGNAVRSVDLGAQSAGIANYDWDGTKADGTKAGDGPYTVSAVARDTAGKTVASRTLVWAPVTSVSMPAGSDPVLTLPGIGQVSPTAVRAVA